MSEKDLNGQSGPEENATPTPGFQVRPPDGQRMARGAYSPEDAEPTASSDADYGASTEYPVEEESVEPYQPDEPMVSTREFEDDFEVPDMPPAVEPLGNGVAESNGHYKPYADPNTPRDKELGLFEHLSELRVRLLWSFLALGISMTLTWNLGKPLQEWFARPILETLKASKHGNELVVINPTGAFSAYFYFSLASGLILAMPFIFFQIWRFIEPALTNVERKYSLVLFPFSTALFVMGATLGYYVSPLFFKFFLIWIPEGTVANWDYFDSITIMAKMLLVFGISFEVPVIVIFLNKLGLLGRNLLIEYWRHAVVVIFTVIAILTPTWDPVTLMVCATPPCLLYVLSIWLVKWL